MREPEPAAPGTPGTPGAAGIAGNAGPAPLIVTLRMDPASAAHFTAMRQSHFPAHRRWLDAHVTLFHALPGAAIDQVLRDVGDTAEKTAPFALRTDHVVFLGGGVAYALASTEAQALRHALASRWQSMLGRQDLTWRGPLHITVQNKVLPAVARTLHRQLVESFASTEVLATGIDVWHYAGGPWRHAKTFLFQRTGSWPQFISE